jgi:uncharacterized protein (DUF1778 family)
VKEFHVTEQTEQTEQTETSGSEARDSFTLSVRLTEQQRQLLERAAELRGWKATNLLRVAALEKAAAIVNTSTLTNIDFKGMARRIAEQMFARRTCRIVSDDEVIDADPVEDLGDIGPWQPEDFRPVEVTPWRMSDDSLSDLRKAAKLGSGEFMNLILQAAEELVARNQQNLPAPIDPTTLE